MSKRNRSRIFRNRSRNFSWQNILNSLNDLIDFSWLNNKLFKRILISFSFILFVILIISVINIEDTEVHNAYVDIYEDGTILSEMKNEEDVVNLKPDLNVSLDKTSIKINLLGEIMMGGKVSSKIEYIYNNSFKNIHSYMNVSDFNYATLPTVITTLDNIDNAKSKYVVTKDALSIFNALNISGLNLATDHINDYPIGFLNTTKRLINEKDISIAGLYDTPMYFEINEKKIAIIAANDVYLNNAEDYEEYGINTYDKERMKENITKAKDSSDFVIVNMHWGRETLFKVTDTMRETATYLVECGADLVIGEHAVGNYPIVKIHDVPVIYSLGKLITDEVSNINRINYIYSIYIDKENNLSKIEMLPIYIDEEYILHYYNNYRKSLCTSLNNQYNDWQLQNGLDSSIDNGKIVIEF